MNKKYPVNIEMIAKKMGYKVLLFYPEDQRLNNVFGSVNKNLKIIQVNGRLSLYYQRFYIARQIAYICLSKDSSNCKIKIDFDPNLKLSKNLDEYEIRKLSIDILLPQKHFLGKWIEGFSYLQMSFVFGVPVCLVKEKARYLGLRCEE